MLERSDHEGLLDEFDESDFDALEQQIHGDGLDPEEAINAVAEEKFRRRRDISEAKKNGKRRVTPRKSS
jgi:hypothetical protein